MGYLETMRAELENEGHLMPVHIAGVNEPGREDGNEAFTIGLGLPWLQDTAEQMAGASWGAQHFDLVILDADNVEVAVYSLLERDLADPANYDEIKGLLASVADGGVVAAGMYGAMPSGTDGHHDGMSGHGVDTHAGMDDGAHAGMDHDGMQAEDMHGMHDGSSCPTGDSGVDLPASHSHHR